MPIVDMSHPRIQAYIKALREWEQADPGPAASAVPRFRCPKYAAVFATEMKLTRFEVRAVHAYLAEQGQ